ncbi:MAG: dihydrofolate reductase [Bacteroidetes bacterium]|nr:dihydrofolate reductase [Bacteroidota bacterium]MDA1121434.1 dihydrofolate reductase [Bacteroidota bacterium]
MKPKSIYACLLAVLILYSCQPQPQEKEPLSLVGDTTNFQWLTEQFADLKIVRYQIPGWEKLTAQQRKLVYYLTQAGYEGRDIQYAMNYRHNLTIRKALEKIYNNYQGDRTSEEWKNFHIYLKRIWFSNGIHHHYSMNKIVPTCSKEYLSSLFEETNTALDDEAKRAIFDPEFDAKKVNLDPSNDLLLASAVNFYDPDVSQKEVEAFYAPLKNKGDDTPIWYGLNSKIVRNDDGSIREEVYRVGGLYSAAIEKMIGWLEKAIIVAENEAQANALKLLINYYQTGDLATWDEYNIAWLQATAGDIDYITGFVEVYNDPLGYRGSFETVVEINDFEASERMKVLMDNAQWFEDNSPIMDQHKKESVVGVTYKVVNVAGESGDSSPSTPIGVNLPNSNWIRATHGSKSVSLGNIVSAYDQAAGAGFLDEFVLSAEQKQRARENADLADNLHTAMHEVIGHASGKIEPGVGTPSETLKNYRSTLEEGRADLVALYYLMDNKLVELGLVPSLETGKAHADSYILNGLMLQLRRLQPGEVIEEAHMRNRAMVSRWVYEKGKADNVIEKIVQDGKTYFRINDYDKLKVLFGQLLSEVQRIKSQGDYNAVKTLIETYGVQVDRDLHNEVLDRSAKLNSAPYGGFINPKLVPVVEGDEIIDVRIEYPSDFTEQMLYYSKEYGNL